MELKDLLPLLHTYGVKSFKSNEFEIDLDVTAGPAHVDLEDDGEFQILVHETQLVDEPAN